MSAFGSIGLASPHNTRAFHSLCCLHIRRFSPKTATSFTESALRTIPKTTPIFLRNEDGKAGLGISAGPLPADHANVKVCGEGEGGEEGNLSF